MIVEIAILIAVSVAILITLLLISYRHKWDMKEQRIEELTELEIMKIVGDINRLVAISQELKGAITKESDPTILQGHRDQKVIVDAEIESLRDSIRDDRLGEKVIVHDLQEDYNKIRLGLEKLHLQLEDVMNSGRHLDKNGLAEYWILERTKEYNSEREVERLFAARYKDVINYKRDLGPIYPLCSDLKVDTDCISQWNPYCIKMEEIKPECHTPYDPKTAECHEFDTANSCTGACEWDGMTCKPQEECPESAKSEVSCTKANSNCVFVEGSESKCALKTW